MTKAPDIESEEIHLPEVITGNEQTVRRDFWAKLQKSLARIPFADRAVAAYYCALDPQTPVKVKATLLAALAYFIMPLDLVPDMLLGLGFTDDMAVLATAYGLVSSHMKPEHIDRARQKLAQLRTGK